MSLTKFIRTSVVTFMIDPLSYLRQKPCVPVRAMNFLKEHRTCPCQYPHRTRSPSGFVQNRSLIGRRRMPLGASARGSPARACRHCPLRRTSGREEPAKLPGVPWLASVPVTSVTCSFWLEESYHMKHLPSGQSPMFPCVAKPDHQAP